MSNEKLFDEVLDQIDKIKREKLSAADSKKISREIAKQIVKRTRLGKGVKNGRIINLKKLSDSYIQTRKGKVRFWKDKEGRVRKGKGNKDDVFLSNKTRPSKSNLTATGQLLDAIEGDGRRNQLKVTINDLRLFDLFGKPAKIGNNELVDFVEKARPFFALSNSEVNQFVRKIRQLILKKLTRN